MVRLRAPLHLSLLATFIITFGVQAQDYYRDPSDQIRRILHAKLTLVPFGDRAKLE